MILLGIDPGSRVTGFGVIDVTAGQPLFRDCGVIRLTATAPLSQRIGTLFTEMTELLLEYRPDAVAIEQVFVHRNVASALKLGQARGAAIAACVTNKVPVHEYTPAQVKQAITGKGNASKEQVQYMVSLLLGLQTEPQADAADALAMALCHGRMYATTQTVRRRTARETS